MTDLVYELVDFVLRLASGVTGNLVAVFTYPINPHERVFIPYLVTSLIAAVAVYLSLRRRKPHECGTSGSLAQFLFPSSIWRTRSAWLDVRYFFFHQVVKVLLYGSFVAMASNWAFHATARLLGTIPTFDARLFVQAPWHIELGYALVSVAILDFVAYAIHYCQHRLPLLWEFHKVHHSATVMHPLTNYREHPVDNITYAVGLGAGTGVVVAVTFTLLGYVPTQPTVLGSGIFVVAFNALGYNLRHSHIWLKWPGPLVYLFGSPAHHQVHHSYHPAHINKNFAFMFPVWDVMFRTFHIPDTNADVRFGIGEDAKEEFTSCLELYYVPFLNVSSTLAKRMRATSPQCELSAPVAAKE